MNSNLITVLTFTEDGRMHCDGLSPILRALGQPGLRPVRIGGGAQPGVPNCADCPKFVRCGMSHVSTVQTSVDDIAAVKLLCKENGWTFLENQKTYRWYGTYVGDAPLPEGMTKADLGKCSHAISVPGSNYDIGLVRNRTGGYTLAYDYWGTGAKLKEVIGVNGGRFLQGYGVAKATLIARSKGYCVNRTTLSNGSIKLQVTGVS